MATERIRIGVVGVRNIGRNHVIATTEAEGATVAAIADTDPSRLAEVGDAYGVPHRFTDAEALLRSDAVDAVILATPNHLHAPMTVAALEAGKHVLVEKPMARTVAEADAMIAARDASGKVLMVGMNQRFSPRMAALRAAVDGGALGRLQYGRTGWTQCRPHDGLWGRGDWFLSKENAGGGPLLDLGVHRLDLALYLLGFPAVARVGGACASGIGEEEAKKRGKRYEIEDGAVGWIRFADGAALLLEASYFQNTPAPGLFTHLYGDRGSLDVDREEPLFAYDEDKAAPRDFTPDATSAGTCAEHFVRVLRGKEALIPTAEQGREGLRIIEAIYASAERGEEIVFAETGAVA